LICGKKFTFQKTKMAGIYETLPIPHRGQKRRKGPSVATHKPAKPEKPKSAEELFPTRPPNTSAPPPGINLKHGFQKKRYFDKAMAIASPAYAKLTATQKTQVYHQFKNDPTVNAAWANVREMSTKPFKDEASLVKDFASKLKGTAIKDKLAGATREMRYPGRKEDYFWKAMKKLNPDYAQLDPETKSKLYTSMKNNPSFESAWQRHVKDTPSNAIESDAVTDLALKLTDPVDEVDWSPMHEAWQAYRPEYAKLHGGSAPDIKPAMTDRETLKGYFTAPRPKSITGGQTSFTRAQPAATTAQAKVGEYVPGLGVVTAGGKLSKGITEKVGGAPLATKLAADEKGDYISQGPQSVDTAKPTLRPKLPTAGAEDVRPDPEDNLQSDALFEAFSWVPDGYGQGPNNALHLQNKQNDQLRFGQEQLAQPRADIPMTMPRPTPYQWAESMSLNDISEAYVTKIGMEILNQRAVKAQKTNPIEVLHSDYNQFPSSSDLPRHPGPSPYQPVINNLEQFLPARDPSGVRMNALRMEDTRRGTFGYRRRNVYSSLMM
jgi:hypothetical protein